MKKTYKVFDGNIIKGELSIPIDEKNNDYIEYLLWVSGGGIPEIIPQLTPALELRIDSNIIIGNGIDEIILNVSGEPNTMVTINTLTGDTTGTLSVQLDDTGNGSQVFSCETSPTVITFSAGDATCKVRAL